MASTLRPAHLVAAPFVAFAALRALGLDRGHPLVSIVAFTPYVALLALLPVALAAAGRRWVTLALAAAAFAVLAVSVLPRARDGDQPRADGPTLTVMTLNMDDGRADPRQVLRIASRADVDVLAVQESRLGVPRLDAAGARRLLPRRAEARYARGGAAILAAAPIEPADVDNRGSHPVTTLRLRGAAPVVVQVVHPVRPTDGPSAREWRAALEALPAAPRRGDHRVLAGDFNATLDHALLREVLDRGWRDAADAVGAGLRPTFRAPPLPPIAIDHVLVDERIRVTGVEVHDVDGTDHHGVVAHLALPSTER